MDVFKCLISKKNWTSSKSNSNDYEISNEELLLQSERAAVNAYSLRILCARIYKIINNRNPDFMKDLFSLRETSRLVWEKYRLILNISVHNQVTFGSKKLSVTGPKVWNSLPYHIKSSLNCDFKFTNSQNPKS